jgi:hypothetical protein
VTSALSKAGGDQTWVSTCCPTLADAPIIEMDWPAPVFRIWYVFASMNGLALEFWTDACKLAIWLLERPVLGVLDVLAALSVRSDEVVLSVVLSEDVVLSVVGGAAAGEVGMVNTPAV